MNRLRKDLFRISGGLSFAFLLSLLLPFPMMALAGQRTIISLPDTVHQNEHSGDLWDTITFSSPTITSTGNGLYLAGSGSTSPPRYWLVDGQSQTIEFGTADGNSLYGLKVYGGSSTHLPRYIKIQNLTINHKPTHSRSSDTTIVKDNICISLSGYDITIANVNMMADGYNGKCLAGGDYNIEVSGGHYKSLVNYFRSRCQVDAGVIKFEHAFDSTFALDSGYTYSYKIHGIKIDSCPHMGIRVDGGAGSQYGIFKIYACTIMVDARNLLYSSYAGTCASCSNPYGIAVQHAGSGSEFYDNIITSGTNYDGGRGMLFENCSRTGDSMISVHDNYIDIHEGPNVEYNETHIETHALRIRNDCQYMHVYNNTVIGTGDADVGTPTYGRSIAAIRYTFEGSYGGVNSNNLIENNTFRVKSLTSSVTAYAVCFDAVLLFDTTLVFRYNRIEGDNVLVKYGEINEGAKGITLYGDTLKFITPTYNPQTFVSGHLCNNWDCTDNFVRDEVYENGTSDTNITFSCPTSGTLELGLQRLVSVKVNGKNGLPVQGASVSVTNNYGATVLSDVTNSSGLTDPPSKIVYWWESRTSIDSTNFNDFTIKAKMGTDSTTISHTMTATSTNPIIILHNTDGGGSLPQDTIPPEKIDNLGAATGLNEGEVILTWTAPGDDSTTGKATSYSIRYRTGSITESNWNSSNSYSPTPNPKGAGSTQTYTVKGLVGGQKYYFAIKAYDSVQNASALSNVPSAKAQVDLILGTDDNQVALFSPSNQSQVNISHPVLAVKNIAGTQNSYHIEVALDSNFIVPAAASPPLPQEAGEKTFWKVDVRLNPNQTYFWRAKANDYAYSNIYSFSVQPVAHAYPNPFKPIRDQRITFTELPESCSLLIVSVSGMTVRRWASIVGGEQTWDGANEDGNPVGSGAYLWYIEGAEFSGKIILIR